MRIKLQFKFPLPPQKCWFVVQDQQKTKNTSIKNLKKNIIKTFQLQHINKKSLKLELDGFELNSHSPLSSVLKEDELVKISLKESLSTKTESHPKSEITNQPKKRKSSSSAQSEIQNQSKKLKTKTTQFSPKKQKLQKQPHTTSLPIPQVSHPKTKEQITNNQIEQQNKNLKTKKRNLRKRKVLNKIKAGYVPTTAKSPTKNQNLPTPAIIQLEEIVPQPKKPNSMSYQTTNLPLQGETFPTSNSQLGEDSNTNLENDHYDYNQYYNYVYNQNYDYYNEYFYPQNNTVYPYNSHNPAAGTEYDYSSYYGYNQPETGISNEPNQQILPQRTKNEASLEKTDSGSQNKVKRTRSKKNKLRSDLQHNIIESSSLEKTQTSLSLEYDQKGIDNDISSQKIKNIDNRKNKNEISNKQLIEHTELETSSNLAGNQNRADPAGNNYIAKQIQESNTNIIITEIEHGDDYLPEWRTLKEYKSAARRRRNFGFPVQVGYQKQQNNLKSNKNNIDIQLGSDEIIESTASSNVSFVKKTQIEPESNLEKRKKIENGTDNTNDNLNHNTESFGNSENGMKNHIALVPEIKKLSLPTTNVEYSNYPQLTSFPKKNMKVAFKIAEIDEDLRPLVPYYRLGMVKTADSINNKILVQLLSNIEGISEEDQPKKGSQSVSHSTKSIKQMFSYDMDLENINFDMLTSPRNHVNFEENEVEAIQKPVENEYLLLDWDSLIDIRLVSH
ncbi:hypothetical protein BB559_006543 [Furculomyces boomerangus]|uniref:Coilin tudor domain-containing protein n=1 Tax=Furculomyces boomerangus TaxID=61424 RepID=A0A2T9Y217_9FUNG|nr:hypothetical protein BB559_006543 [Furculomyces boomerangus]